MDSESLENSHPKNCSVIVSRCHMNFWTRIKCLIILFAWTKHGCIQSPWWSIVNSLGCNSLALPKNKSLLRRCFRIGQNETRHQGPMWSWVKELASTSVGGAPAVALGPTNNHLANPCHSASIKKAGGHIVGTAKGMGMAKVCRNQLLRFICLPGFAPYPTVMACPGSV